MRFTQGDIVKVNLDPICGHEQGNFRPVLVLNTLPMPGNINLVVPITTKQKTYPLEVVLDNRTNTQGCILCFQMRALDLNARDAKYVERLPQDLTRECVNYCKRLISPID